MTPWTVAYQAPLSMGFSRQRYWSELPFSSAEDLPDPGIVINNANLFIDLSIYLLISIVIFWWQLFHSPLSLSSRGSLVPLHFLP